MLLIHHTPPFIDVQCKPHYLPAKSKLCCDSTFDYRRIFLEWKVQPPYGGLLSSYCGGLGPFGPKGDFAGRKNGQTDGRMDNGFKGVRFIIHLTNTLSKIC